MSKKSPKIAALIEDCRGQSDYSPYYWGFFKCFNQQLYYEAHDVLEELWLEVKPEEPAKYYQGLIQLAGAFVHLQKNRLEPSMRLFRLAQENFMRYPDHFLGYNLSALRTLCAHYINYLESTQFQKNPWSPDQAPQLVYPSTSSDETRRTF